MTEQDWIGQLKREGYTDVRVCPMPPRAETPQHTHDVTTVHVILDGKLTGTGNGETQTYKPGDRVEFLAGTTHQAHSNIESGRMIIGVKSA